MQKLIMAESNSFLLKEPEIGKLLADGWDIYEGPFSLGNIIILKLVKHEALSYARFQAEVDETTEDEHPW